MSGTESIKTIKRQLLQDKDFLSQIEKSMKEIVCQRIAEEESEESEDMDMDEDLMLAGLSMFENQIECDLWSYFLYYMD